MTTTEPANHQPKPAKPKRQWPDWLSRKEAAAYLLSIGCPIAPQTLAKLAANHNAGKGPPFTRIGWKMVRYAREELDVWAKGRTVHVK